MHPDVSRIDLGTYYIDFQLLVKISNLIPIHCFALVEY